MGGGGGVGALGDICHYWYFLDENFNYKPYLCNSCHDLMQKAMTFNDFLIHFWYMNRDDGISIMNNSNLNEKIGVV